ncbi:P-loop containing nucleoside triphosphate hydrolase protein [Phycomyces nitens]|nr:P-loop containing nucleoside triphosphate hydrolase protein [Phycomyces nitens]
MASSLKIKLISLGYDDITDIQSGDIIQLTQDGSLTEEEVMCLLQAVHGVPLSTQTAADRILSDTSRRGISFGSQRFNSLFGQNNGLPLCKLTEICGESGAGKTQLSMQLAVNVQLPVYEGGLESECIYIDTEGSFAPSRIKAMVSEKTFFREQGAEEALKKIHVFRVFDHTELMALLLQLPEILKEYKVKLIVIDSIAFHFRLNVQTKTRLGLLDYLGNSLAQLANRFELAVLLTNHVTAGDGSYGLVPALGKGLSHWCTHRFFVFRKHNNWHALMFKSPDQTIEQTERFWISSFGITDLKDIDNEELGPKEDDNGGSQRQFDNSLNSDKNPKSPAYPEDENGPEVDCWDDIGPPDDDLESMAKDYSDHLESQDEETLRQGETLAGDTSDSFDTGNGYDYDFLQQIGQNSQESSDSYSYTAMDDLEDFCRDEASFRKRPIEDHTYSKRRRVIPNSQGDESEYNVMLRVTNAMNYTSLYEDMQDVSRIVDENPRRIIPNSQQEVAEETEDKVLYELRMREEFLKKHIHHS